VLYNSKYHIFIVGNLRIVLTDGATVIRCLLKSIFLKSVNWGNEIKGRSKANILGRNKKYFACKSPEIDDGEKV
jgi:hypothetical protein